MGHIKKYLAVSFVLFALFVIVSPRSGHPWDTFCWAEWADYCLKFGLGKIYNSATDYFPLYHYILKLYSVMEGSTEAIHANKHYLKIFTLVFHFLTGYFVYLLVKREKESWDNALINSLFYLANIAVLYNVIIWSQVDIILACFVFISVYYAMEHKALPSLVFLLLGLNFKLHAIIFVPVVGLLLLPEIITSFSIKKIALWLFILCGLQCIILLPFIIGGSIQNFPAVITGSVGKFAVVSAYAFNMWHLLLSGDLANAPDNVIAFGLSYNKWGLLLFFLSSTFALFPLLKNVYISIRTKTPTYLSVDKILLICSLIPLLFFYFNTQMHERYSHPALVFLITYCIRQKTPLLAFIASVAYFLNLEAELKFLQLPNYGTLIFDTRFISVLWLITIIGTFSALYGLPWKRSPEKTASAAAG